MARFPARLTKEEEMLCTLCLKSKYQKEARETLILHNLRLVYYIVEKYDYSKISLDELVSEAQYGLVQAADTFSWEKKTRFPTYAVRCMENAIAQKYRDQERIEKWEISVDWESCEDLMEKEDFVFHMVERKIYLERLKSAWSLLTEEERKLLGIRFLGDEKLSERTQLLAAETLGCSQSYVSRMEKNMMYKIKKYLICDTIRTRK